MDLVGMVSELRLELDRIERSIEILEELAGAVPMRPSKRSCLAARANPRKGVGAPKVVSIEQKYKRLPVAGALLSASTSNLRNRLLRLYDVGTRPSVRQPDCADSMERGSEQTKRKQP